MKNLLSVCIFILALVTISCSGKSYMTEDVFTVGEGAEVRVAILYKEKSFDISVTVTNTSQNTMVLVDAESLRPNRYVTLINSFDEKGVYIYTGDNGTYSLRVHFDFTFYPDSLVFLESGESEKYTQTYEYYLDESLEKVILDGTAEVSFNKDDQIYCLVRYDPIQRDIEAIEELTDEYLLEPFEKKYLLEFPGIDPEKRFLDRDFEYTIENGKATITDYIGNNENLVIPEKLGEYEVTSIGYAAFMDYQSLSTIEIPDSITSIGDRAFENCISLTAIEIPNSVTSIGESAFENCTSLTAIKIPNSVKNILNRAFYTCDNLANIEIPDSVTSIGDEAFVGCDSLESIEIPNSVTNIGAYAFSSCNNLVSIEIPNSVTSIGNRAFSHNEGLTSIKIPDSVTSIGMWAFFQSYNATLIITEDSYAHEYAIEEDIDYVIE